MGGTYCAAPRAAGDEVVKRPRGSARGAPSRPATNEVAPAPLSACAASAQRPSLAELLEQIYAGALDGGGWNLLLQRLAGAFGARRALVVERCGERRLLLESSDPIAVKALLRSPAGGAESPGEHEGAVEVVLRAELPTLHLLLERGPLEAGEAELLRRLAPHVARAWRVTHSLAEAERRLRLTGQALDRLATGVALVDAQGLVLAANAAAERLLAGGSDVRIEGGRLLAHEPALARRLAAALLRLGAPHAERSLPAEVLRLRSGRDESTLELLLLPLATGSDATDSPAVLFVYEPSGAGLAPADLLEKIYGLTPAEARVVGRILVGRTLEESARDLGVGLETVRTHLQRVFRKVGTTRQADLVRLLLAGPARLRWP